MSPVAADLTTVPVLEHIRRLRLVPLIVIEDPALALPLADALVAGGLPIVEVAFRTPKALEALRLMAERADLLAGAGTVLDRDQAARARDAGARFVVAPGLHRPVVEYCLANGVPVIPGVCTPSEIMLALELGLRVLKFFPAEPTGGVPYLQAIAAPFGGVSFIPTGGISAANVGSYLALPCVAACGGSWMAPQSSIAAGEFDRIRREVDLAVRAIPLRKPR